MTQIFLPAMLAHSRKVVVEGLNGGKSVYEEARQTLFVKPEDETPGKRHGIVVSRH